MGGTSPPEAAVPGESFARGFEFRLYSWPTAAVALLVLQAVLSLTLNRNSVLIGYCESVYLILLLLASGVAALNAVRSRQTIRLFWWFLAVAFGVWALVPCSFIYNVVLLGRAPAFLFVTPLFFLHIVLLIAAVAARPHLRLPARRPYRITLNFLTLLFFVVFAYSYLLFPYEYTSRPSMMILHFEAVYFVENLLLLWVLGTVIVRSQSPWKSIYWNLFGASALYVVGSVATNIVWAFKAGAGDLSEMSYPTTRGLMGMAFTACISWFVWVGLLGLKRRSELAQTVELDTSDTRRTSVLAMVAVVAIPLAGIVELFPSDEPPNARSIRLLIVLIAVLLLAVAAFIRDYLSNREFASDVGLANDRLRLAMESGGSVGWDWDIQGKEGSWFGDVQTMFEVRSSIYAGQAEAFHRYIHPDDREQFWKAINNSMETHTPFSGEFRIVRPNGALRHVAATGKCYYSPAGRPERTLGVALDITDRKRAERDLRESEERFRLVADTAPVLIWMSGTDKLHTFFNKGWLDFTGRAMERELGEGWASGVHPHDVERLRAIYSIAFDARVSFESEHRLRRFDGKYRWLNNYGVPRFETDGTFCGYIGSCVDITDRKTSEEALEELSGRLITAQEEERTRIARELHDDFSQRLAIQGVDLEMLWQSLPESEAKGRARVLELLDALRELTKDMHSLSHQLHSSKLEYLGLGSALKGLCGELSSKYKIKVEFTGGGVSSEIPKDVALCLFRIAQEALGNVVKHSGAKQAQAVLSDGNDEIRLRIVDDGVGFDPSLRSSNAGIGLIGMRERLRLVGGSLSVRSAPLQGTEILAQVPLPAVAPGTRARAQASGR
jgi:PAS domain S-box-containing protein